MPPHTSIRTFLVNAKASLQHNIKTKGRLTFVIGNESADLDSLTSSLVYAYIRSATSPPQHYGSTYIPVTNIPASDIQLRPEFLALLPRAGLEASHLITLDDLPMSNLEAKLRPEDTQFILVDHNALQGLLGSVYASRVAGVIDHHEEENKVPKDTGKEPRIIETSGSCTSLVVNYLRDEWDRLPKESAESHDYDLNRWNSEVAQLAIASILVDTASLKDKNKVTKHDEDAVGYLESKLSSFDRSAFYNELQAAKQDIGSIPLQGILRKDYKEWDCNGKKLGIASVVKPLNFLIEKASEESVDREVETENPFTNALKQFVADHDLDILTVMTTFTDGHGQFQRELMLYSTSNRAVEDIKRFTSDAGSELDLQTWSSDDTSISQDSPTLKIFHQKAVQHSRKRVAPLLRQALEGSRL